MRIIYQEQKNMYKQQLLDLLDKTPSVSFSCSISHCNRPECINKIQQEYDNIIKVINESDKILPRHKPGAQKHWWTDELTKLKEQSIDIHRLWLAEGKPRSGITNCERLRVRAAYRRAIKKCPTCTKTGMLEQASRYVRRKKHY